MFYDQNSNSKKENQNIISIVKQKTGSENTYRISKRKKKKQITRKISLVAVEGIRVIYWIRTYHQFYSINSVFCLRISLVGFVLIVFRQMRRLLISAI